MLITHTCLQSPWEQLQAATAVINTIITVVNNVQNNNTNEISDAFTTTFSFFSSNNYCCPLFVCTTNKTRTRTLLLIVVRRSYAATIIDAGQMVSLWNNSRAAPLWRGTNATTVVTQQQTQTPLLPDAVRVVVVVVPTNNNNRDHHNDRQLRLRVRTSGVCIGVHLRPVFVRIVSSTRETVWLRTIFNIITLVLCIVYSLICASFIKRGKVSEESVAPFTTGFLSSVLRVVDINASNMLNTIKVMCWLVVSHSKWFKKCTH